MKTNVTLKLDADLLKEARVVAAEEGRSISAEYAANVALQPSRGVREHTQTLRPRRALTGSRP